MSSTNETTRTERGLFLIIMFLGCAGLVFGWRVFWFLTDDAYIAFRYISNSLLGYGYVWNVPPFHPVEGYTSFLWIVLLDIIWRLLGIAPPTSANWITLGFSCGTLLIGSILVMRTLQGTQLARLRLVFVALFIFFLLFNRTFLAWSSSGLETAMMDFLLLFWVFIILGNKSRPRRACLGALTAAGLALGRPDGLLFCVATGCAVLLWVFAEQKKKGRLQILLYGLLPFFIPLGHLAWRVSFYGEWLPNTFYAKVIAAWPESGFRYLLSFTLEYAFWFPTLLICWALAKDAVQKIHGLHACRAPGKIIVTLAVAIHRAGIAYIVIGALLIHCGYYTYVVGGDHFEYRIYAHLVPLMMIALFWSLNRLRAEPRTAIAVTLTFVLLSMPVQWTHWVLTKDLHTRHETKAMYVPIASHWPTPIRWYADLFDKAQAWLIDHSVCLRHQEHKIFWQVQTRTYPTRNEGRKIPYSEYPVIALPCVGVPSWVLPHVFVIDTLGLNDYVIARTPLPEAGKRVMAHSRIPPKGYVKSYRPNVEVSISGRQGIVFVSKRTQPITSDYIDANEQRWRSRIRIIEQRIETEEGNNDLGLVYAHMGKIDEAITEYKKALAINPNFAEAYYNLGNAYSAKGQTEESIAAYKRALAIDPNLVEALNNLGLVYEDKGMLDDAILEYQKALTINHEYSKAAANLSAAYSKKGSFDDSLSSYQKVLATNPSDAKAYFNLGMLYTTKDRVEEAIFHFRQAITINPNYINAYNNLAWIYATSQNSAFRNGEKAVALAIKACELTQFKNVSMLDTLAAAYAETRNFEKAIEYQKRAIDLSQTEVKPTLLKRLEIYQSGQPYRHQ